MIGVATYLLGGAFVREPAWNRYRLSSMGIEHLLSNLPSQNPNAY